MRCDRSRGRAPDDCRCCAGAGCLTSPESGRRTRCRLRAAAGRRSPGPAGRGVGRDRIGRRRRPAWHSRLAVGLFGLLGLVDDLRGLPAVTRLRCRRRAPPLWRRCSSCGCRCPPLAVVAAAIAAALWLVGFVNAFNFMDGVNGISGAHALIGGVAYACLAGRLQDGFGVAAGLALAVGAAVFLPWNAVRARVFLGDVGSYSIGRGPGGAGRPAGDPRGAREAVAAPVALYLADVGMDAAAPGAARRTVDGGAPDARLPALVRRGVVARGGHAADVRPDRAAVPARRGRDPRRNGGPGGGRPGWGRQCSRRTWARQDRLPGPVLAAQA